MPSPSRRTSPESPILAATSSPQGAVSSPRRPHVRLAQSVALATVLLLTLGASDPTNPAVRFDKIGHQLMCPCGCAEILVECNHVGCPDSSRMIAELRAQISAGPQAPAATDPNTNTSILLWFSQKYGATVLAAPLRGDFDNVAWIAPFAVFFLATIGTAATIRLWKLRSATPGALRLAPGTRVSTETTALRERVRRETQY